MKKSNRIVVISLVSILLVSLLFIVILREKKTGKDEKQNAPQREVDILYNQYITDTENKEKELDSSVKQREDLKLVNVKNIYDDSLENDNPTFPSLDCGKEKVEFTLIPDPYRKEADENLIFEDHIGTQVINKANNKIIQKEEVLYRFLGISKFTFRNTDYYITEEYTGGAHCCSEQRVISCKDGKVNIGGAVDFASNGGLGDFFIKNNQVYFTKIVGVFDYFNLSYSQSGGMEFPAFYKLDINSNKFINASNEFPEYYSELVKQQNEWLVKLKNYQPSFFNGAEELWYYPLIKRLTASYLSGENEEIYKKQFVDDFNYFIDDSFVGKQQFLFPIAKKDIENIFNDAMKILIDNDRDATTGILLMDKYKYIK